MYSQRQKAKSKTSKKRDRKGRKCIWKFERKVTLKDCVMCWSLTPTITWERFYPPAGLRGDVCRLHALRRRRYPHPQEEMSGRKPHVVTPELLSYWLVSGSWSCRSLVVLTLVIFTGSVCVSQQTRHGQQRRGVQDELPEHLLHDRQLWGGNWHFGLITFSTHYYCDFL